MNDEVAGFQAWVGECALLEVRCNANVLVLDTVALLWVQDGAVWEVELESGRRDASAAFAFTVSATWCRRLVLLFDAICGVVAYLGWGKLRCYIRNRPEHYHSYLVGAWR